MREWISSANTCANITASCSSNRAPKSTKAFLRKVRTVIKANKSAAAGSLICLLNPLIRGWAQYHRHVVSAKVFQSVDHAIFQSLWRWVKRRHSNKGVRWVKARYFHHRRHSTLGVCGGSSRGSGTTPSRPALQSPPSPHLSPSQNRERGQSLRSPLGTVLRAARVCDDGCLSQRAQTSCSPSGNAKVGNVPTVERSSLRSRGGTTIISSPACEEARRQRANHVLTPSELPHAGASCTGFSV